MNREIKFRAWDLDNQAMYYQELEQNNGEGDIFWVADSNGVHFEEPQVIDSCPGGMYHEQKLEYRKPNQVSMQYTGLKDKNGTGKEIYEGDIVEFKHKNNTKGIDELCEIVWDAKACRFARKTLREWAWHGGEVRPKEHLMHLDCSFQDAYWQTEVIGNIYETPELLNTNA